MVRAAITFLFNWQVHPFNIGDMPVAAMSVAFIPEWLPAVPHREATIKSVSNKRLVKS
jgi:hypothetical protein